MVNKENESSSDTHLDKNWREYIIINLIFSYLSAITSANSAPALFFLVVCLLFCCCSSCSAVYRAFSQSVPSFQLINKLDSFEKGWILYSAFTIYRSIHCEEICFKSVWKCNEIKRVKRLSGWRKERRF